MELSKNSLEKNNQRKNTNCNLIIWAYPPPAFFVWLRAQKEIHQ
jgi:hypothetical protein